MAASTTEGKIADLLLTHLGTLVLTPALPVAMPNVDFKPSAGTYLEATFLPNSTVNMFRGSTDPNMHQGILQVAVVYKAADGVVKPVDIAGQVVNHFPKGLKITGQGITIRIDERPSITSPIRDDDRLRIPVSVRYKCYI